LAIGCIGAVIAPSLHVRSMADYIDDLILETTSQVDLWQSGQRSL